METWSDQALIRAALGGDLGAFDGLMRRYERLVFKVAVNLVRNPDSAFDVVQSVFLKAFQRLGQFRHEANVKTWLLRITYNESIDWIRCRKHRDGSHGSLEDVAELLAVESNQEREILRRDDQALITRAMGQLNHRYRMAVDLRYFQGMGIPEIAQVIGCSEGVTKNMLFRSLRTLRESLLEMARGTK